MGNDKKNIVFGVISLVVSAVLQAVFSCYLQNTWIVLVFACIYAVWFLKYLKDESVVNWIKGKVRRNTLKVIGIIVLFLGISLLLQQAGQDVEIVVSFITGVSSYICWMSGLLLIDLSNDLQ